MFFLCPWYKCVFRIVQFYKYNLLGSHSSMTDLKLLRDPSDKGSTCTRGLRVGKCWEAKNCYCWDMLRLLSYLWNQSWIMLVLQLKPIPLRSIRAPRAAQQKQHILQLRVGPNADHICSNNCPRRRLMLLALRKPFCPNLKRNQKYQKSPTNGHEKRRGPLFVRDVPISNRLYPGSFYDMMNETWYRMTSKVQIDNASIALIWCGKHFILYLSLFIHSIHIYLRPNHEESCFVSLINNTGYTLLLLIIDHLPCKNSRIKRHETPES